MVWKMHLLLCLFLFFVLPTYAVDYMDCWTKEMQADRVRCKNLYDIKDATNPATACTYYNHMVMFMDQACCDNQWFVTEMNLMQTNLTSVGVTNCVLNCKNRGSYTQYVDCDSNVAFNTVSTCQKSVSMKDFGTSAGACTYFTKYETCIPSACCDARSYADMIATDTSVLGKYDGVCKTPCGGRGISAGHALELGIYVVALHALAALVLFELYVR